MEFEKAKKRFFEQLEKSCLASTKDERESSQLLTLFSTISILLSTVLLSGHIIRYFLVVVPHYYYVLILLSYFLMYLVVPINVLLAMVR